MRPSIGRAAQGTAGCVISILAQVAATDAGPLARQLGPPGVWARVKTPTWERYRKQACFPIDRQTVGKILKWFGCATAELFGWVVNAWECQQLPASCHRPFETQNGGFFPPPSDKANDAVDTYREKEGRGAARRYQTTEGYKMV